MSSYKIIFIGHPLCPHCPKAENVLQELKLEYKYVSLDTKEGVEYAEKYGIMSIPAIVLENDVKTKIIQGYSPKLKDKLIQFLLSS